MSTNRRVSAGSSAGSDHGSLFDVEDGGKSLCMSSLHLYHLPSLVF